MAGLPGRRTVLMKVILRPSSGIRIVVWREHREFHARRAATIDDAQICLAVDLFEVIAELAELDLENEKEAAEATALATEAQRRLAATPGNDPDDEWSARAHSDGW